MQSIEDFVNNFRRFDTLKLEHLQIQNYVLAYDKDSIVYL